MPLKYENYYVCKKYTELSVEQTIVPGRLHSELCVWGVKFSSKWFVNIAVKEILFRKISSYILNHGHITHFSEISNYE